MVEDTRKNVFVLGLDDWHLRDVQRIPDADSFRFHALLRAEEVVYLDDYRIEEKLDRAREILHGFDGEVHAIIGHWDFPVSVMLPILCEEMGLVGPSLESVLKCEHKYWSRIEQRKAAPESTPDFCAIDPFAGDPFEQLTLDYPCWIKPVKAYSSALGFRVNGRKDFDRAIEAARLEIRRFGDPFDAILKRIQLPDELCGVGGNYLIAEQLVGGWELAPEGYVQRGELHSHGMVDMVRSENHKSFLRYEYPSRASDAVKARAVDAAERILRQIGYDDGCFNVEFFRDPRTDRLWIIEINPRISQSHSYLFSLVDGMSNHEVAIHVALGDAPRFARGGGKYQHAAKFLHRRFDTSDAVVTRVPSEADLARLASAQPDTHVKITVEPGMRLSELKDQDAYSYVLAEIEVGARSVRELNEKYRQAADLLPFGFRSCAT